MRASIRLGAIVMMTATVSGCGLQVQLPDLFAVTRTGAGTSLTVVVNDSGQVTCNGSRHRTLSSSQLITARDLADSLSTDATKNLMIPPAPGAVYRYRVKLQQGTITFPDRAGAGRPHLAQMELFTTQVAEGLCGLGG